MSISTDSIENNKVNRAHEMCLWLIYNSKKSLFHELIDSTV